jgi:hypothetical protein
MRCDPARGTFSSNDLRGRFTGHLDISESIPDGNGGELAIEGRRPEAEAARREGRRCQQRSTERHTDTAGRIGRARVVLTVAAGTGFGRGRGAL